nr:MAG TPA: hypothetical protein [Caudoviricetes sp.]
MPTIFFAFRDIPDWPTIQKYRWQLGALLT